MSERQTLIVTAQAPPSLCWQADSLASGAQWQLKSILFTLSNLDCSICTCAPVTYWLGGFGNVTSPLQPQLSSSPGPLLTLTLKSRLQGYHLGAFWSGAKLYIPNTTGNFPQAGQPTDPIPLTLRIHRGLAPEPSVGTKIRGCSHPRISPPNPQVPHSQIQPTRDRKHRTWSMVGWIHGPEPTDMKGPLYSL